MTPSPPTPVDDLVGPTTGATGTGGFTLNVSELFKRMKESNWRKREERMKRGYLPILPSEPQASAAATRRAFASSAVFL